MHSTVFNMFRCFCHASRKHDDTAS